MLFGRQHVKLEIAFLSIVQGVAPTSINHLVPLKHQIKSSSCTAIETFERRLEFNLIEQQQSIKTLIQLPLASFKKKYI